MGARSAGRSAAGVLGLLLVLSPGLQAQVPAGAEFRVNTYTTNSQLSPAVAMNANGDFVVVWTSVGQDGSGYGIFGQIYDGSGTPEAGEFQVNSSATGNQSNAVVAWSDTGHFMVAWNGFGDGNGTGVFARRFTADGVAQGADFRVNSYTTNNQRSPAVAVDGSGNFVVVWGSHGQVDTPDDVFGQRLSSLGVPLGGEFHVNTYTTGPQYTPAVAADKDGNFVVVWYSSDGDGDGVFARRYDAAGVPQGGEFRVNSSTSGVQNFPSVAADAAGNFVVTWDTFVSAFHLLGQRYDASGATLGGEFQINTYTGGYQVFPVAAMDPAGGMVVTWQGGGGEDGDLGGIFARRFDAAGPPAGDEFQANTYTTGRQTSPRVAMDAGGDFAIVWYSPSQDGSNYGVFGRRYGDLIFRDDVETGSLSRWSAVSTDGGNLSTSAAAALDGTDLGLQAFVNDLNPLYVQDDRPTAETRYRARFSFDPNGFDPGEAGAHFRVRIFIAFDDLARRALVLVLKRQNGLYGLMGRVRRNDGTRVDTGFFPISNAPHSVEVDWQRASGPSVADGSLEMWIDGVSRAVLSGIDDDTSSIESARLGALSLKTGATGTLFFDQFESRRQAYIGPD